MIHNEKHRNASKQSSEKQSTHVSEGVHPLFYRQPIPIDFKRHGKAGLLSMQNYKFASETNSIPLNAMEFVEAAKFYPIVFTSEELAVPTALVGLEKTNYFVNNEGKWKNETYIPAYVRKYPFIFMHIPEQKQFVLCIDEAADQLGSADAEGSIALYGKDEKPSEATRSALEFSTLFYNHHMVTCQFSRALKDAGLLVPNTSNLTLFNGRQINLKGFQMIDEQKFNALPDQKILEFRQKGWLPFIYFALMSATNWQRLADMASLCESKTKVA